MSSSLTAASFLPDADSAGCGTVQHVAQPLYILAGLRVAVLQGTTTDVFHGELKG